MKRKELKKKTYILKLFEIRHFHSLFGDEGKFSGSVAMVIAFSCHPNPWQFQKYPTNIKETLLFRLDEFSHNVSSTFCLPFGTLNRQLNYPSPLMAEGEIHFSFLFFYQLHELEIKLFSKQTIAPSLENQIVEIIVKIG